MEVTQAAAPAAAPAGTEQPQGQPVIAPAPVATAIPAQAPAAAPAPAAPATAAEPAAKTEPGKAQFGEKVQYNKTGSDHLDIAVNFFGGLGLDLETLPGYAQAAEGDFSVIKAHIATLNIPGADAYVSLAEAGLKTLTDAEAAKTKAIQDQVVGVAGDAETWTAALEWVREQTQDAEGLQQREDLNKALAMGGLMTQLAAEFIFAQYSAQSNVSIPQRKSATGEHTPAAPAGGSYGLSAREYADAVDKLRRENPGQELEGSNELHALRQRRLAGQRQGK